MQHIPESLINQKINFVSKYISADNAADGSKFDANANVSMKNIATLETELNKDINIAVNRRLLTNKITELFGEATSAQYTKDLSEHLIYTHDESSLKPYCVSASLYPMLLSGLKQLGGESEAPAHLESFCGSFINTVFAIAAQFAGAVATVEFLTYFDHFARTDLGDDYLTKNTRQIDAHLQHVVYSLNQPAAARGYQSVFWNISIFSEQFWENMFENFVFPDGKSPEWESIERLQKYFMQWFNKEREKSVLTYPVVTVAILTKDKKVEDVNFARYLAEQMHEGNSFFVYMSDTPDSLASCCRLRNEITDNTFSYSLGAGGVATGSINVITINFNRLLQRDYDLKVVMSNIHKYQVAYRRLIDDYKAAGMLPVYDAGFITLDKQFLTVGINGMVEAAEHYDIEASNTEQYKGFVSAQLKVIYDSNREAAKAYGYKFNTEFVPAENLGVKNAKWDREDGLTVKRDCYNSYFYAVENDGVNAIDKFILHGEEINQYLDGGSALHLNLDDYLSVDQYMHLFQVAAKTGCNYWTTNTLVTVCNDCNHIDKRTKQSCPKCGSENIDWCTRIIGYLKKVSSFSSSRQKEHALRHYHVN